uniref:NADH-ubiquinone oxidoreductase chain 3 n=1 Tax=Metastrongylus pudendotectus TaxID=55275 RepID=D3J832_METPU|nr:NADH dehydrogenase subunit 3 [Metastrongylus pudendotectus]ACX85131.1 NADH dehydrogenase subunit 3 [Metastrongylus pudendotectus]
MQVFGMIIVFLISLFFIFIFYLVLFFMSLKFGGLLKVNSFESGFLSSKKIQNSFSIHFFVIMMMFVVFDLEVVMFLGLLVSDLSSLIGFFFLFFFVLIGFYMEWFYGKLIWVI